MSLSSELSPMLQTAINVAKASAQLIFSIYQQGEFEQHIKTDDTPVTSADLAAHRLINQKLKTAFPDIPVLSEEEANIPLCDRADWSRYWLIDPLDGTQEFIAGSGDFASIIALIENNKPVIGVVCSPVTGEVYYAEQGQGAWKLYPDGRKEQVICRHYEQDTESLSVAISRRQDIQTIRQYFTDQKHYELVPLGSASLKACLVAEGKVDCYLRVGPTGEWDTGATQCIVEEAGGKILDLFLSPLTYNQRETLENPNFIVIGDNGLPWNHILTV